MAFFCVLAVTSLLASNQHPETSGHWPHPAKQCKTFSIMRFTVFGEYCYYVVEACRSSFFEKMGRCSKGIGIYTLRMT